MGCSLFIHCACCSQGGGVAIKSGTVNFDACEIFKNTAFHGVRALYSNVIPQRPNGVLAFHVTWALLAGRWRLGLQWTGDLPVVPDLQQPGQCGEIVPCEQTSHRPDGMRC